MTTPTATPQAWCAAPLLAWTPEALPGCKEALAAIAMGETPTYPGIVPSRPAVAPTKPSTRTRKRVDVTALKVRLARVEQQLEALARPAFTDRAAAWMNTGTASGRSMARKHFAAIDTQLVRYNQLTSQRATLRHRIARTEATP